MLVEDSRVDAIYHKLHNIMQYAYALKDDTIKTQLNILENMITDLIAESE